MAREFKDVRGSAGGGNGYAEFLESGAGAALLFGAGIAFDDFTKFPDAGIFLATPLTQVLEGAPSFALFAKGGLLRWDASHHLLLFSSSLLCSLCVNFLLRLFVWSPWNTSSISIFFSAVLSFPFQGASHVSK